MRLTLAEKVPLLSSFRYRNYRLYWGGMMAAAMGNHIQQVSLLWLVYDLTGSPLSLGLVGGAQGVSQLIFTLLGGVVADRVDRRRLLILMNSLYFFLLLLLAVSTVARLVTVWHLVAFSSLSGVVAAFEQPTRHALLPHLIEDRKDLMNAIALNSTIWQMARILGPAVAGIMITTVGTAVCFFIAAATYVVTVVAMMRVKVADEGNSGKHSARTALWEGVEYVRRHSIFSSIIGMVSVNSLFGMSFIYLMPVFARDVLHVDSRGYGFLMTSLGLGTLTGTLLGASLGKFKLKHLLLIGGSGLFGLLLILFAFSRDYASSVTLLALAGFVQHMYMLTAQVVLQSLVPDEVRGRVMAIYSLVWSLNPLGSLQAGAIANYSSAPVAVAIGGAAVTVFTLFMVVAVPRLRKLEV